MPHVDFGNLLHQWFGIKVMLWSRPQTAMFKEREIWWCSVGMNVGEEIFGKGVRFTRPVLVFKKFTARSFLGIPLTSQQKVGSWYVGIRQNERMSSVMLNQARVLDSRRLTSRVGTLDDTDFQRVSAGFRSLYCP